MPIEVEINTYRTPENRAIEAASSKALFMSSAAATQADHAKKRHGQMPGRTAVGGGGALVGMPSNNPNERLVIASRPKGIKPNNTTQQLSIPVRQDVRGQPGTQHSGRIIP